MGQVKMGRAGLAQPIDEAYLLDWYSVLGQSDLVFKIMSISITFFFFLITCSICITLLLLLRYNILPLLYSLKIYCYPVIATIIELDIWT